MSKKRVNDFPPQYRQLVEEASEKEEFFIKVPGTGQDLRNRKISLRAHLSRFFAAIKREAEEWEGEKEKYRASLEKGLKGREPTRPWAADYAAFCRKSSIGWNEEGLRIYPKAKNILAEILEAALSGPVKGEEITEGLPKPPGEGFLKGLLEIQKERDEAEEAKFTGK